MTDRRLAQRMNHLLTLKNKFLLRGMNNKFSTRTCGFVLLAYFGQRTAPDRFERLKTLINRAHIPSLIVN